MRYVKSRYRNYQRDLAYRIYITDSLQLAAQNKYLTFRYADYIAGRMPKPDNRSGDDIALDIINRFDLKMKE